MNKQNRHTHTHMSTHAESVFGQAVTTTTHADWSSSLNCKREEILYFYIVRNKSDYPLLLRTQQLLLVRCMQIST